MATDSESTKRAGAFDIRMVIALLIGVYGLVITILGIGFTTEAELAKADGLNINLWAGLGMLLFAASFVAWVKIRPLRVPAEDGDQEPTPRSE
ncbi:hypothetical protein SAMN05216266_102157 [Amycolatopsis marina]|uniref:Uncharacterized protein n=1 Tax=Amycolatopsis marina TaxID=490629 RepID=A0A1I0WRH5_9PSEU|nr:hypothetical protein [Amycolatopsis marina]SFA91359.1 hypothetical protein SAMN05216266_102157 [Amycolatopsis marina]